MLSLGRAWRARIGSGAAALSVMLMLPLSYALATPADLFAAADDTSKIVIDHSVWDRFLAKYVKPDGSGLNAVDYAAFRDNDREPLRQYIGQLEKVTPATLSRPEQFALLANLYNAKTIEIVLDHYPVASIKDISLGGTLLSAITGGPWKKKVTQLGGTPLSLDDIEHGVLRPVFQDPRVHYALNCASIGCPNLRTEAYTSEKLEAQLDEAARDFVNSKRGVVLADGKLRVSSIFSWFIEDFGGDEAGVIAHLKRFAAEPLSADLDAVSKVHSHFYDWNLNNVRQ